MLTALTIKNEESKKWYKRLFNSVRGNSLIVNIKSARGVVLRDITYICRNGTVNWFALDNEIGAQRNHLLCDDSIVFPENMGFKRFENTEFKRRLACNLGIYVLSKLKGEIPDIKTGLYDPEGELPNVLKAIVNFCGNTAVVSDNAEAYEKISGEIMDESGASVFISDKRDNLAECELIIAPCRITESIPASGSAIVLTSFAPTVCTSGLVYFDYHFRMPNMFDRIKPESLSCEYFSGALFTKGRQYELGSIVPTTCSNFTSSQTPRSICDYLIRTAR